jgi:uncharacterized membrane protein
LKTRETLKPSEEERDASPKLFTVFILGFSLTIFGLLLVLVATVLSRGGSTSFGGIIFIGPIPIVFGAGPGAPWLILFAIILATLSIVMFLTLRRKADSPKT